MQAAARLGVKPATLYAYVSRGVLPRHRSADGRTSLFDPDDLARIARRGGGRQAPSDVTVASELCLVEEGVLAYRGVDVLRACRELHFEELVWWLWTGSFERMNTWRADPRSLRAGTRAQAALPRNATASDRLPLIASALSVAQPRASGTPAAGDVMACLTDCLPGTSASARYALRVAKRPVSTPMVKVIDAAMSLACERGLTYSSLTARMATVTGNGVAGAVAAAMQTALPHARAMAVIENAFAGGAALTGEARELASSRVTYKDGDPRAAVLLEMLGEAAARDARVVSSAAAAIDDVTIEFAMAGVGWACGVPSGTLLLVSRTAGWIAHALEERRNPTPYRPRLAYTGPPLRATTPRRTLDAVQQYLSRQ